MTTKDYSSFGLKDKIAIVTGASQGIGRAIAVGLAQAGAHVVLAKHPEGRQNEIKSVQAEIEALGRKAPIVMVDVNKVDQVRSMIDETVRLLGRVDILVNNASWTGTGPALDVTEEEYDKTLTASLKSVFFACQAAARVMIPQGSGKIINIGSNFGEIAFSGRAVYAAAKAGVHHLSRALSLEWAKSGVTGQRGRAMHHRDRLAQSDSRAARLQGMGRHTDSREGAGISPTTSSAPCCSSRAISRTWSSATC